MHNIALLYILHILHIYYIIGKEINRTKFPREFHIHHCDELVILACGDVLK
jgi:hypothetical protein